MTSTANSVGTETRSVGVRQKTSLQKMQGRDSLPPTEQREKGGALQTAPQSSVPSLPADPPADNHQAAK